MFQLNHHGFFKLYLPKNRDPENMDWNKVFMEESHLHYNGEITEGYKYDQGDRTILDIDLLPSFIYLAWYSNQKNPSGQFQRINQTIDRLFSEKLLRFNPIYKCVGLLDYHINFFQGEKVDFFFHIKHQILPICKEKFNNKEKEIIPENWHISFDDFEKIILEWIDSKSKEEKKINFLFKIKSLNWLQILSLLITTIGVLAGLIVDWDRILNSITKYFDF